MKACVLALLISTFGAVAEDGGGGGYSPCQDSTACEKEQYCYEGACVPYLEQDDGSYDNIIVGGNDDAFFGWNDDDGVPPVKKAAQKKDAVKKTKKVKGTKTMNDDATIVVSSPDINGTAISGDDADATHESTAPASATCKANDDCPRGANGHINRCIEGTCKDIGITSSIKGVKGGVNLAAAAPSQRLQAAAAQSPSLAVALVVGGMALIVGAAVSVRRSVRSGYTAVAEVSAC